MLKVILFCHKVDDRSNKHILVSVVEQSRAVCIRLHTAWSGVERSRAQKHWRWRHIHLHVGHTKLFSRLNVFFWLTTTDPTCKPAWKPWPYLTQSMGTHSREYRPCVDFTFKWCHSPQYPWSMVLPSCGWYLGRQMELLRTMQSTWRMPSRKDWKGETSF